VRSTPIVLRGALARKLASDTGSKVEILAADLTNSNDLARLEQGLREDSRITLLVNNAGAGATEPLLDMVDAALADFDHGEFVTIPALPAAGQRESYAAARQALMPNLSRAEPAGRSDTVSGRFAVHPGAVLADLLRYMSDEELKVWSVYMIWQSGGYEVTAVDR
jgi:hypothetical protein